MVITSFQVWTSILVLVIIMYFYRPDLLISQMTLTMSLLFFPTLLLNVMSKSSIRQAEERAQRYARRQLPRQLLDEPCVDTECDDDLDDEDVTCTPVLDKGTQTDMKMVPVASVQTEPLSIPHSISIVTCFIPAS